MQGHLADDFCAGVDAGASKSLWDLYTFSGCTKFTLLDVLQQVLPDNNRTLLMSAAKRGCFTLCEEMLQHTTIGINTQNSKGYTAMHFACFHGHTQVAILLLSRGADMNILNHYRETALQAALAAGHHELSRTLWCHGHFPPLCTQAMLTPQVAAIEGITTGTSRRERKVAEATINCLYLHDLSTSQWLLDSTASAAWPSQMLYSPFNSLTRHLDPFPIPVNLPDSTHLEMACARRSDIVTVSVLCNCLLQVVDCDPGCTVAPGLTFDFGEMVRASDSPKQFSFSIGRSSCSSICLSDMSISKEHAMLNFIEGIGLCVTDTSKHGTIVNNRKVYNQTANVDMMRKHSFLERTGHTLSVGRVHLELKRKEKSSSAAVVSSMFAPNQQLGKQLVGALKQQQMYESQLLRAQNASAASLSQRQVQSNIATRVLMKRQDAEQGRLDDSLAKKVKTTVAMEGRSLDFESSGHIGRSMLASMGWKEGSALGAGGGAAKDVVEVARKTCRRGLGSSAGITCGTDDARVGVWEKTQSRFDKITKESK